MWFTPPDSTAGQPVGGTVLAPGLYRASLGTITIYLRATTGYELAPGLVGKNWAYTFTGSAPPLPFAPKVDYNNDGTADIVARDGGGTLWLYPGNGSGGWLAPRQVGTGWNVMTAVIAAGDFNGDNTADILARNSAGDLLLYPGSGSGGYLAPRQVGTGWNGMTAILGVGDFNGDGQADILARNSSGALWLYPGDGRGGWLAPRQVGSGWNTMTAIIGVGDSTATIRST